MIAKSYHGNIYLSMALAIYKNQWYLILYIIDFIILI